MRGGARRGRLGKGGGGEIHLHSFGLLGFSILGSSSIFLLFFLSTQLGRIALPFTVFCQDGLNQNHPCSFSSRCKDTWRRNLIGRDWLPASHPSQVRRIQEPFVWFPDLTPQPGSTGTQKCSFALEPGRADKATVEKAQVEEGSGFTAASTTPPPTSPSSCSPPPR